MELDWFGIGPSQKVFKSHIPIGIVTIKLQVYHEMAQTVSKLCPT